MSDFDPARIHDLLKGMDAKWFEPVVRDAADRFYDMVLNTAYDYLVENLDYNLSAQFAMLERENQRMRTELYEVDRALSCPSASHGTRLEALAALNKYATKGYAAAIKPEHDGEVG